MTVRVANDFKTEAQLAHEQLVLDNKTQRDKIRQLEAQLEKLTKSEYKFVGDSQLPFDILTVFLQLLLITAW